MDAMKIAALIVRIGGSGMNIGITKEELMNRVIELAKEGTATGTLTMKTVKERMADALLSPEQFNDLLNTLRDLKIRVTDEINLLDKYIARMRDEKRQEMTINSYTRHITNLAHFIKAKYTVNILTDDVKHATGYMVSEWDEDAKSRGLKDSTRVTAINSVRPYLHFIYVMEFTARDLGEALPHIAQRNFDPEHLLAPETDESRVYSADDIQRMISIALDHKNKCIALRDAAIIATLAASGLRLSELTSIPYGQIRNMDDSGIIVVKRKGGKYAKVAIAKFAHSYIRAYQNIRGYTPDNVPFFLNMRDYNGISNLNVIIAPIQKKAGVRTGIHNFRHTVVTNVARKNDSAVAAMIAGHTTDSVTRRHYIHPSDQDKIDVINDLSYADDLMSVPHKTDEQLHKTSSAFIDDFDDVEEIIDLEDLLRNPPKPDPNDLVFLDMDIDTLDPSDTDITT